MLEDKIDYVNTGGKPLSAMHLSASRRRDKSALSKRDPSALSRGGRSIMSNTNIECEEDPTGDGRANAQLPRYMEPTIGKIKKIKNDHLDEPIPLFQQLR